jgi:hypothetical protein
MNHQKRGLGKREKWHLKHRPIKSTKKHKTRSLRASPLQSEVPTAPFTAAFLLPLSLHKDPGQVCTHTMLKFLLSLLLCDTTLLSEKEISFWEISHKKVVHGRKRKKTNKPLSTETTVVILPQNDNHTGSGVCHIAQ